MAIGRKGLRRRVEWVELVCLVNWSLICFRTRRKFGLLRVLSIVPRIHLLERSAVVWGCHVAHHFVVERKDRLHLRIEVGWQSTSAELPASIVVCELKRVRRPLTTSVGHISLKLQLSIMVFNYSLDLIIDCKQLTHCFKLSLINAA